MKKITVILLMVLCVSLVVHAVDLERYIGLTGLLTEGGAPVTGYYDFRLSIWTDGSIGSGTKAWEEEHQDINVLEGEFSLYVGSVQTLINHPTYTSLDFTSNTRYWLQIEFKAFDAADTEYVVFETRKSMNFVPYAFSTDDVNQTKKIAFARLEIVKADIVGLGIPAEDTKLTEAEVDAMVGDNASVIEVRTDDPASPVTGQMWLRSDL